MKTGNERCLYCDRDYQVVVPDVWSEDEIPFDCPYCRTTNWYPYWCIRWVQEPLSKTYHTKLIGRYDAYAYRFDYYDYLRL